VLVQCRQKDWAFQCNFKPQKRLKFMAPGKIDERTYTKKITNEKKEQG